MILQALTAYYQTLADRGEIAAPGWGAVKVTHALTLGDGGEVLGVVSLETQGKGNKPVPRTFQAGQPGEKPLPKEVRKTSGIASNFLYGNSTYILGMDDKGKPERTMNCFQACRALHEQVLEGVETPAAKALLRFFRTWQPEQAAQHPALQEHMEGLLKGGNLIFTYQGTFVHNDPEIRQAWERHYNQDGGDGPQMVCLVTGERGAVEGVHPAIKNVRGAQSSGAALVSFNAPAFCSYGKEQNFNAPTGKFAAFAYTTALNHLLQDRDHVNYIGDTTVVCWAKGGGSAYQSLFSGVLFDRNYTEVDLLSMVNRLCRGECVEFEQSRLDPNMEFYVLGLSPNAARISVRFFLQNTFGGFLANAQAHQKRLEMVRPVYERGERLSLWRILDETVSRKVKDRTPAHNLAGAMIRSVLTNTPYPASILQALTIRIRADHTVNWPRAAMIKAYYAKHPHFEVPEEVLTVSINYESKNPAYRLGRLFAILERIQEEANRNIKIKATITDRYFSSASATPAYVFPQLLRLAQKHLSKMEGGLEDYHKERLCEVMDGLEGYPKHLSLPQQGDFQLGYYHQTQAQYQKQNKEEK